MINQRLTKEFGGHEVDYEKTGNYGDTIFFKGNSGRKIDLRLKKAIPENTGDIKEKKQKNFWRGF